MTAVCHKLQDTNDTNDAPPTTCTTTTNSKSSQYSSSSSSSFYYASEEQEMEAEALSAIFGTDFQQVDLSKNRRNDRRHRWEITLTPTMNETNNEEFHDSVVGTGIGTGIAATAPADAGGRNNNLGILLCVELPSDYPEDSLPILDIQILKGLAEDQRKNILDIAMNESKMYKGMPAIYAICEAIRTWLMDHNDDDEDMNNHSEQQLYYHHSTHDPRNEKCDGTYNQKYNHHHVIYRNLEASCPHVTFSRLTPRFFGGSYSIISESSVTTPRVVWIITWSTCCDDISCNEYNDAGCNEDNDAGCNEDNDAGCNEYNDDEDDSQKQLLPSSSTWYIPVMAIPIINCTQHTNKVLMELANSTIQRLFQSSLSQQPHPSMDIHQQMMQDPIQQFEKTSIFLNKARQEISTLLSKELEQMNPLTRSSHCTTTKTETGTSTQCRPVTISTSTYKQNPSVSSSSSSLLNDFSTILSYSTTCTTSPSAIKNVPPGTHNNNNHHHQQSSFEYIDIYQQTNKMEMEWIQSAEKKVWGVVNSNNEASNRTDNSAACSNSCQICFEEFTGDEIGLSSCHHLFCRTCWRGLLQSAASSGEAVIHCPCFQCPNIIGIHDIAHILFDSPKYNNFCGTACTTSLSNDGVGGGKEPTMEQQEYIFEKDRDTNILIKLMQARMQRYLVENQSSKKKGSSVFRFCSNACCRKILNVPKKDDKVPIHQKKVDTNSQLGSYISMCTGCGTGICSKCHQNAHYGISCEENLKIRMEIVGGNLEDEISALHFLQTFTSPCPKCDSPIIKDGGCNHMRCANCNYYFCWVCGGRGEQCNAYQCKTKVNQDYNVNAVHRGFVNQTSYNINLPEVQDAIRDYAKSDWEFRSVIRKQAIFSNDDDTMLLEVLLRQVLLWSQGLILYETVYKDNRESVSEVIEMVKKIYLTLNALQFRVQKKRQNDLVSKQAVRKSKALHHSTWEEDSNPHRKSLRKKNTMNKWQEEKFHSYETKRPTKGYTRAKEQESQKDVDFLSRLCNVSKKRFQDEVFSIMNGLVQSIVTAKKNT